MLLSSSQLKTYNSSIHWVQSSGSGDCDGTHSKARRNSYRASTYVAPQILLSSICTPKCALNWPPARVTRNSANGQRGWDHSHLGHRGCNDCLYGLQTRCLLHIRNHKFLTTHFGVRGIEILVISCLANLGKIVLEAGYAA